MDGSRRKSTGGGVKGDENKSSSDTDTSSSLEDNHKRELSDAVFDHTLAMRKSAPRGGTWKFAPNNLSVEIPLGPVTLFSDKSVSIHSTQLIVWTFKVEPVKITNDKRIRRERYCFGLVPEKDIGNPGFLLIEEGNPCRMEGGYPLPGKLHTVMISPVERRIYFFMENLPNKYQYMAVPPELFPCRLGILAFMHQTIEVVNDLHPKEFYDIASKKNPIPRSISSGATSSQYARFLASDVPCFKSQNAALLQSLFQDGRYFLKTITKGEILQFDDSENSCSLCIVYTGSLKETLTHKDSSQPLRILKRGDFFQERVLIRDQRVGVDERKYFNDSQEDAEVLVLPRDLVLGVFSPSSGFPDTVCDYARTLSKDLCEVSEELCATLQDNSGEVSFEVDVTRLLSRNMAVCDNLAVLSLTKCNIRVLNFKCLPKSLKKLCLGFNHFDNLDSCNFKSLKDYSPNIAELFLHCNKLKTVPAGCLKHLTCLKELGLDSNNIKDFDLADLPLSLTKLWLSNNVVTKLEFNHLKRCCPHIVLLDLSFNRVSAIEADEWPDHLVHFYIAGNGIKHLDFKKIPTSLQILDIGGSDVTTGFNAGRTEVESRSFTNYVEEPDWSSMLSWENLQILDVAHNHIDIIEERTIPRSCIALFAAQNKIKTFKPKFLLCAGLQILDLSNNEHIDSFDSACLLSTCPALRILNLYNNALKTFDTSSLPELKTLWLGKNQLTSFVTATLPITLKILSLTHNQLQNLDFAGLPPGLDILNVNHNKLVELPVRDLPSYLQQLEFKANQIEHFDWQEVAENLQHLMSIKFEKNKFLDHVDEAEALSMFRCILSCPNLALKPDEFVSYLQKFTSLPEDVVGNSAWLNSKLPVPAVETIFRNNWKWICKYMKAVSRCGGSEIRSQFSVVYVPPEIDSKLDIKPALSAASLNTPRIVLGDDDHDDVTNIEILRLSPYELRSRSIMSHQRICVLTMQIDNDTDPEIDCRPVFACLQHLYHSTACVSVIVLLCNRTDPSMPLQNIDEVRDDVHQTIESEIERLNNLSKKEMTSIADRQDNAPSSGSSSPPPEHISCSIIQKSVEEVSCKIADLRALVEKSWKSGKLPALSDDSATAVQFWEDIMLKPECGFIHKQAEKLWTLYRKLHELKARSAYFYRSVRANQSKNAKNEGDLLQLKGVLDFCDCEAVKNLIKEQVMLHHEVVPKFFETIRLTLERAKAKAKVHVSAAADAEATPFSKRVLSRDEILKFLKEKSSGYLNESGVYASRNRNFSEISEIPDHDLWEALLHCASLGFCFILNNSFFPDPLFVRKDLADALKKAFPREQTEFNAALREHFESTAHAVKNLAKRMWLITSALGVFTSECAKFLKHWKAIEGNRNAWRNCMQFFEQCGVVVPFFQYSDDFQCEMQWQIARESFTMYQDKPVPTENVDVMHAFYILNVSPTSLITRFWTELVRKQSSIRDGDDLIKLALPSLNSIQITQNRSLQGGADFGRCQAILQEFPAISLVPTHEFEACSIRALQSELKAEGSTELLSNAGAMLHLTCTKRDSALFRFCIEGLEQVLKAWYPDFKKEEYVSIFVPDLSASKYMRLSVPLSPIFDQNAHKNVIANGNRHLPINQLFPRTCSIFLSHVYEGDGTSHFTDMLKDFLERRFICSVWYDKSNMGDHSAFFDEMKTGLSEASSVIICLTPLYLTRPNCLRELKWALDLRDKCKLQQRPFSVRILALHPTMTFAGRDAIKRNRAVFLPKYQHTSTPRSEDQVVVHMLSDHAVDLLARLDANSIYPEFIDAMPWRSDYDDWAQDVPDIDLTFSETNPLSVAEFFSVAQKPKTVLDLMDSFCSLFAQEMQVPPFSDVPYGFEFAELQSEQLHSKPRTLEFSDQDQHYRIDNYFEKFLKKEESHFSKSLFRHEDMYLLTLMGFTVDQLIHLLDHPIGFRDPGAGHRSVNIDKWIRKGALLALSRDFSSVLRDKKKNDSKSDAANYQPTAHTTGLQINRLKRSDSLENPPQMIIDSKQRGSSVYSEVASPHGAEASFNVQMMKFFPQLTAQLSVLNETHKEFRMSHLQWFETTKERHKATSQSQSELSGVIERLEKKVLELERQRTRDIQLASKDAIQAGAKALVDLRSAKEDVESKSKIIEELRLLLETKDQEVAAAQAALQSERQSMEELKLAYEEVESKSKSIEELRLLLETKDQEVAAAQASLQSERQNMEELKRAHEEAELKRGLGANNSIASSASTSVQESFCPPDVEGSNHVEAARRVPVSLRSLIRAEVEDFFATFMRFVRPRLPTIAQLQMFVIVVLFYTLLRMRTLRNRRTK